MLNYNINILLLHAGQTQTHVQRVETSHVEPRPVLGTTGQETHTMFCYYHIVSAKKAISNKHSNVQWTTMVN